MKKTSLGTGLSSLIPKKTNINSKITKKQFIVPSSEVSEQDNLLEIETGKIIANPHQPRKYFEENNLKELANSIKEHGILQPLVVSKIGSGQYELIAGERRLEASKLVNLKTVPVIVRSVSDQQKLELALVENVQRHNLNPIEEARAYLKLADEFNLTQKEIAQKSGKSRSMIANSLRLLDLPIEIQRGLMEEKITAGHARAILALDNPEKQRALYQLILKNGLSVRAAEEKVKSVTVKSYKRKNTKRDDPAIQDMENRLQEKLKTKVQIKKSGRSGKVVIEFYSEEELGKIVKLLNYN